MSKVGQPENATQAHIIDLFCEQLGYEYLGDWHKRDNANIEDGLLAANLAARGHDDQLIKLALAELHKTAAVGAAQDLYEANKATYELLRYGAKVKRGVGQPHETVWLIDWEHPEANHFGIAEEVTVVGMTTKRPDLVLYVNGIALGVVELKRSKVSVSEGIRQTIGNQRPDFIRPFFSTIQFVFAGNDVEGLRYGCIETPEKFWLAWKEPSHIEAPLDRALTQMCAKGRFCELIHDFVVFDVGVRKCPRHNQYFGVKAAQAKLVPADPGAAPEGGIVWHTQGSGKSLTMVWLAKWALEHLTDARILLITDRTELDDQIRDVFRGVGEEVHQPGSATQLIEALGSAKHRIVCSLVHKFGATSQPDDTNPAVVDYARLLSAAVPDDFEAAGNFLVFVDEAHRTQSGQMHDAMKALLPDAIFIGFTGTPLLKRDKATTMERFGPFIHTYRFDEAVKDGVVLDLRYEARKIELHLADSKKIDDWFEAQTKGLTDLAKAEVKKRWGTIKKVNASKPKAQQIVADIMLDMATKPRLMSHRGNALLVSSSIYQACTFYQLFCQAGLEGRCAIVTSYAPTPGDIAKEDAGAGANEAMFQYEVYTNMLAKHFKLPVEKVTGDTWVTKFERDVKEQFVAEPGKMRLLIVVDKLLTGFDAPSATYLYIDKKMQDHGLFQAICRVNRLDGDDKDYGYIVDYQDLFKSLESAIGDYTNEAFDGYDEEDVAGLLTNRIDQGRQDLDDALEVVRAIVEPVPPPKETIEYQHYFCAVDEGNAEQLAANEEKRVDLYKAIAAVARAYANIANDMAAAGYTDAEAAAIEAEIAHYLDVRAEVKLGAGENLDFKQYEAGMRYLLDTYIQADSSEVLATFDDVGLIQLIVEMGKGAITKLPSSITKKPEAVASTIVNNMRKVIIDEHALNPKYYERMSRLLDDVIAAKHAEALDYETYLNRLIELAEQLGKGEGSGHDYPDWAVHGGQRALVDHFWPDTDAAHLAEQTVLGSKTDAWVGHNLKEKKVRLALAGSLPELDAEQISELLELVKARDEYR